MIMKKKILFIYGQLNSGGAERVLLDVLRNLDYAKYEVDLCQIIGGGILCSELPHEVKIINLWESYTLSYKIGIRLSNWFRINFLLKRRLRKKIVKKYDVEISFLEGTPLKIHALLGTQAKKITWVHCDLLNDPYEAVQFGKGEELEAYNKMDTIVFVSNNSEKAFHSRFPSCRVPSLVIYNPIDVKKIIAKSNERIISKNEKFTIISVGRLVNQKRFDRVIRLASIFKQKNENVLFEVLGDGPLYSTLQEQVKSCKLDEYVHFLGYVKNPYPYIKRSDIFLSTSEKEGFGLVLCEAMLLEIPVISMSNAGSKEIITNHLNGFIVDDLEHIFELILNLKRDIHFCDQMKEMAKKRVMDFSVEVFKQRFQSLVGF